MINQKVIAVVALLAFVAMITRGREFIWAVAIIAVIGAGAWFWSRRATGGPGFGGYLCDSCKYSYGDVCRRPEKPNATECPDYKRAG